MKNKILCSLAIALVAPFALAQVESTTTTTTTEGVGTITEYTPGDVLVLKETSGERKYKVAPGVTYVTKGGKVISKEEVGTRVKVGTPVHVHYSGEGDEMVVDKVIVDED